MGRHRYTVSLLVTGPAAVEIDGLRRALGAESLLRIPPHVTLVPPLNVAEEDAEAAFSVVRSAAAAFAPIAVTLGGPATFWPPAPVVYLEVGGEVDDIARLAGRLGSGPLAPPAARPSRPFVAHVTVDQRIDPARIAAALATLASYRAETLFERVTVLEQDPAHVWHPVGDAPLGGPVVSGRGGFEIETTAGESIEAPVAEWARRQWTDCETRLFGGGWSPDQPFAVTARHGREVIGIADGVTAGSVCRLGRLIVSPSVRATGVGARLLAGVERLAAERGCRMVRVEAAAGGSAEGFFRHRGYHGGVRLPAWRHGVDFVVMERQVGRLV